MRIAFLIRILMMHAMRGHPGNRPAFDRERAAGRQNIFDPFRSFVPAMRQQAVIAHADAETAAHPIRDNSENESFPGEEEKCHNRHDVQSYKECGDSPNYRALEGLICLEKAHGSPVA